MGYGDWGMQGAPTTHTPNVNKLASEGAVFTQWHAPAGRRTAVP